MKIATITLMTCVVLVGAWMPSPCQKAEDCGKNAICRNQKCMYLRMGPILPPQKYCSSNIMCPIGFKCHNRKCKKKTQGLAHFIPTTATPSASTKFVPRHSCYCIEDLECSGGKCFIGRCLKF